MRALAKYLVAAFLMAVPVAQLAAQEDLVTDISQHLISIQSNFTGADLLLFGAVGGEVTAERDIVVVVRGPDTPAIVRRKERIGGIWINYGSAELESIPGYYAVVSTRPLTDIAPPVVLERHGIGTSFLGFKSPDSGSEPAPADYVEAVTRIKSSEGLYLEQPGGVLFLGTSLFRATIEMPANVPDGRYSARVYLFSEGNVVQAQTSTLFVNKVGFERLVYDFAHNQPLAYGIVAVLVAFIAGWAASAVFRRR
ncbi:MAG: TIGR02186 family protein [Rhizobiales bacterium]|nr:TIGR02186 family protein [Hyphomicrobiales bacterium]